jgi:hypothetical protein
MEEINHPSHYTSGIIETMDYIIDSLTDDELRGYIKGNIIKYVSRERHKGGDNDLRKAAWYLNRYVRHLDEKNEEKEKTVSLLGRLESPQGLDPITTLRMEQESTRANHVCRHDAGLLQSIDSIAPHV